MKGFRCQRRWKNFGQLLAQHENLGCGGGRNLADRSLGIGVGQPVMS